MSAGFLFYCESRTGKMKLTVKNVATIAGIAIVAIAAAKRLPVVRDYV